jgi:DNA mismatch repair protein MutL
MSKIRVLPEALANKIAAGEVVERPASVVKELLENSIDAASLNIEIEVEGGGKRLIRVQDDGEGMTGDDALLAFERHATSKLHQSGDLVAIATLGFRGEALPSIASVSRLVLETRDEDSALGTQVEIVGARLTAVKEVARTRGTALTVRDLFFNVPARRKFLRSESTELGHIVNYVTQYALAHPEARFQLKTSGSELFHFHPVTSLRERVFQVFGGDLLNQMIEIHEEVPVYFQDDEDVSGSSTPDTKVRLRGFISKPEVHKLNRNSLYFFVNRRMVRDRIILHAVSEAYRNILPAGIFPVILLFIEMPYHEVDVNVHPSKTEVRFRHQALIHDFLRDSIRKGLMTARPQTPFSIHRRGGGAEDTDSPFDAPAVEELSFASTLERAEIPISLSEQSSLSGKGAASQVGAEVEAETLVLTPPRSMPANERLPFRMDESISVTGAAVPPLPAVNDRKREAVAGDPASREGDMVCGVLPLGQIENSFIVAADRGALLIIDQHVAHERVLFEKVLRQRSQGHVESQRLLLPIIVELTPHQQVILESITPELTACGFEVEPFGRKTIAVKAAPAELRTTEVQHLLNELLESLEKETQAINLTRLREKIAASISCHAAIKVNTYLEHSKMVWLIDELMKTQFPMTCPHGRPIILRYEKIDILKAFKRV